MARKDTSKEKGARLRVDSMADLFLRLNLSLCAVAVLVTGGGYLFLRYLGREDEILAFLAVDAIVLILFSCIVSVLVSRRASIPLKNLNEQVGHFVEGDLACDFKVEEDAPAEVQEIAESLQCISRSTRAAMIKLKAEEQRQLQFVQDVSHELRTPITGIRGNAETLYDEDMPASVRNRFLDIIINECDRLSRLVNNLLTLQKLESSADSVDIKRIDLRKVIDTVVDTLEPLFEEREVKISISGEAPDILGNPDKMTQVMVNLLENASRFATDHVHVELSGLKGNSVITVSDNGPGFGDVDPSRLFDRFYRADASRQRGSGGAGLGLAIVKAIVSSHDGTVEAFNLPDKGACFVVAIPSIAPSK